MEPHSSQSTPKPGDKPHTLVPPLLGNMHPNSNQIQRPENDRASPRTHSNRAVPTLPTLAVIEAGVEKMPVPMIDPMLSLGKK